MKKSPSGSACPYYFMGGELHPLKYGGYFDDKARLFAVMKAEEDFILKSPGWQNRRVWVDLYETTLDDEAVSALVRHLAAIRGKIFRLCLVGCSPSGVGRLKRQMRKDRFDMAEQVAFFSDPEAAKRYLVGEKP